MDGGGSGQNRAGCRRQRDPGRQQQTRRGEEYGGGHGSRRGKAGGKAAGSRDDSGGEREFRPYRQLRLFPLSHHAILMFRQIILAPIRGFAIRFGANRLEKAGVE